MFSWFCWGWGRRVVCDFGQFWEVFGCLDGWFFLHNSEAGLSYIENDRIKTEISPSCGRLVFSSLNLNVCFRTILFKAK